jgi:hypothetical protein
MMLKTAAACEQARAITLPVCKKADLRKSLCTSSRKEHETYLFTNADLWIDLKNWRSSASFPGSRSVQLSLEHVAAELCSSPFNHSCAIVGACQWVNVEAKRELAATWPRALALELWSIGWEVANEDGPDQASNYPRGSRAIQAPEPVVEALFVVDGVDGLSFV